MTIPNLVGLTYDQAAQKLAELGLVATPVDQEDPAQVPGTVLATAPAAGTKVDKGSAVQVTRRRGAGRRGADVVGQDQVAAQATLQAAGFSVQAVAAPSDTVPAGKVVGTDPVAGTKVPKGTVIKMQVSQGPTSVDIPNTIGQACASGAGQLTSAGFNVTINGNQNGTVINQNPSGGSAPPGTQVAITCT